VRRRRRIIIRRVGKSIVKAIAIGTSQGARGHPRSLVRRRPAGRAAARQRARPTSEQREREARPRASNASGKHGHLGSCRHIPQTIVRICNQATSYSYERAAWASEARPPKGGASSIWRSTQYYGYMQSSD